MAAATSDTEMTRRDRRPTMEEATFELVTTTLEDALRSGSDFDANAREALVWLLVHIGIGAIDPGAVAAVRRCRFGRAERAGVRRLLWRVRCDEVERTLVSRRDAAARARGRRR